MAFPVFFMAFPVVFLPFPVFFHGLRLRFLNGRILLLRRVLLPPRTWLQLPQRLRQIVVLAEVPALLLILVLYLTD